MLTSPRLFPNGSLYLPENKKYTFHICRSQARYHICRSKARRYICRSGARCHICRSEARSHICRSEAWFHICRSEARCHICRSEARRHLCRSEARRHICRSEARRHICRSEARCHICQSTTWMHRHLPVQPITVTKQKRISSVAIFAQAKSVRGQHSRHRRIEMFSERACPHHGGHRYFALRYEEDIYEKLKFGDWEKECIACSLQSKVADSENQQMTMRPWEAFQELATRASLRSETKQDFSEIGISLHKGKPETYSIQFVCKACRTATNVLYPVAAAQDKRDEADQTMLGIFEPFFDLVGPIWTNRPWHHGRHRRHRRHRRHLDGDLSPPPRG